jgi:hypothetical protein
MDSFYKYKKYKEKYFLLKQSIRCELEKCLVDGLGVTKLVDGIGGSSTNTEDSSILEETNQERSSVFSVNQDTEMKADSGSSVNTDMGHSSILEESNQERGSVFLEKGSVFSVNQDTEREVGSDSGSGEAKAKEKSQTLTINFLWISCTYPWIANSNSDECCICKKKANEHLPKYNNILSQKIEEINTKWNTIPNVVLNFWYDGKKDEAPLDGFIPNVIILNIRDIPNYQLEDNDIELPLFLRIDYFKNLILLHQIEDEDVKSDYICFVDFDIQSQNFLTNDAIQLIDLYGYVLAYDKGFKKYENSFIMTKKDDNDFKTALEKMITTLKSFIETEEFKNHPNIDISKHQFIYDTYPILTSQVLTNKYKNENKYTNSNYEEVLEYGVFDDTLFTTGPRYQMVTPNYIKASPDKLFWKKLTLILEKRLDPEKKRGSSKNIRKQLGDVLKLNTIDIAFGERMQASRFDFGGNCLK